ncbi:hypothetical protein KR222_003806, partial [Zaprionus bogoriensis]
MESIVLHSDIARLVLGYLINNNLKRAALALCRTSPHLQQEFVALRQGLQPHNFLNGGLEDMIREHVKITGLVANAVTRLPAESRQRLQQLKLSDRLGELLKTERMAPASPRDRGRESGCQRNQSIQTQHKRRRLHVSASPSPRQQAGGKRPRLLAPHLYCSIERTCHNLSLESSTVSEASSAHSDEDALEFNGRGTGPKNNSTPRTVNSDETDLLMPTPQTMPELTQAIMTNEDFQAKLLSNINTALQSMTVNAPTPESVNAEAVLDGLVKNILEATEKDPSFDRIIQEVVGLEMPPAMDGVAAAAVAETETVPAPVPAPPQTPLIIRTAVAAANASSANAEGNTLNGTGNAIIQLNPNNSIGTLIDPNFSISKLIVLNSNESAQKQQLLPLPTPPSVNLNFSTENLINFVDGGSNISDSDVVANAAAAAAAGQVCVDASNGQLTFPMILSNEGLLSHLPFLVNNEWLAQQLRSDAIANADVSHIEIPLPEPITVAANQLPPNSIIINSAVKQPPPAAAAVPPAQQVEPLVKSSVAQLERSASKSTVSGNVVPASLDSSRLVLERVTPSTSGIVNVKAFRSLSTPRKRTSHVRTLNFSPKAVPQFPGTPVSTRRLQQQRSQKLQQQQSEPAAEKSIPEQPQQEQEQSIIIKSVEILPNFGNSSASTSASGSALAASSSLSAGDMSANESNGCVPPLFAMEEGSNQTVIKAVTASKQPRVKAKNPASAEAKGAAAMPTTPKRKQKRRAAVKACKRIISQTTVSEEAHVESEPEQKQQESNSLDDSKENQGIVAQVPELLEHKGEDLMAAWQRQLHTTSSDLEKRLREINAKRQELIKSIPRPRRSRLLSKKKSMTPLGPAQKKIMTPPSSKNKKKKRRIQQVKQAKSTTNQEGGEFIIKITTPHKPKKLAAKSQEIREIKEAEQHMLEDKEEVADKTPPEVEQPEGKESPVKSEESGKEQTAPEHRVVSMSTLFETPFKMTVTEAGEIPPTPGPALMPPLNTPYAKLLPSASFLFGSDTKSILDTPMLTAITPGMRLSTPFGQTLGTPQGSAAKTEYSSGSSYYRPDEAEHTDTNAQCALQKTPKTTTSTTTTTTPPPPPPTEVEVVEQAPASTCFELQAERVPVEPMVLRRVRSFGTEAVDSAQGADALPVGAEQVLTEPPHYKLVSGLPDAIVDNSSSSSCASSCTFSSSSSSSSSGASSSSTDSVASTSAGSSHVTVAAQPAKTMQLLDMQNLSDISSTEDEEWLKVAAAGVGPENAPPLAIDNEPTQLVSQDGEVRYPLRNWLTPSKDPSATTNVDTSSEMAPKARPAAQAAVADPKALAVPIAPASPLTPVLETEPETSTVTAGQSPIKVTLPPKPVDKIAKERLMEQRRLNLAEVRERVKAKVKQQTLPKMKAKKPNKKLTIMRETALLSNPNPNASIRSPKKESQKEPQKETQKEPQKEPQKESQVTPESAAREHDRSNPANGISIDQVKPKVSTNEPKPPSPSDLDPALLIALNLSAKKQQQHAHLKVARVAVEIAAQSMTTGQRRGRPKKLASAEPGRGSMRRSSRLIDNKTPAPEEPPTVEARKAAKATKKPAKKRAEARLEPEQRQDTETQQQQLEVHQEQPKQQQEAEKLVPPAHTLAVAQTTRGSPDKQQSCGEYELSLCSSSSQVGNTFSFSYADNASTPAQAVPRQPASYFKNYQMRIMMDNEVHTVRITSPILLHQVTSSNEESASTASAIRNIPKKRIIHYT